MGTTWTAEQILALAPDTSSAKDGKKLATPHKWPALGKQEHAVWGECQGSGKNPYQTQIDLREPAFRCSCPSRKFPCKHALALFLLLESQPTAFGATEPPSWVTDWYESRAKQAERKAKRAERAGDVVDTKAQAKRTSEREAKVAAGLQVFDTWLRDVVRQGLAAAQTKPYRFWDEQAARLVDAQAASVARRVRSLAGIVRSGPGWEERMLERLSSFYLLIEGYKRMSTLPVGTQGDIRSAIGWFQRKEEIFAEPGVRDQWQVIGRRVEELDDKGRMQRVWLYGRETGKAALLISFAYLSATLDMSALPGTSIDAELVFYPSAYPLRAEIKQTSGEASQLTTLAGYATIGTAIEAYSAALTANPWLEQFPFVLQDVLPMQAGTSWALRDSVGMLLPIAPSFPHGWQLLALSGGNPIIVAGEWDGQAFLPLSVCANNRFIVFEGAI